MWVSDIDPAGSIGNEKTHSERLLRTFLACPVREDHLYVYHEESSREPTHGRTPSEQGVGAGEISGCRGGRANAARQKEKERGEREVIKTRARGRGGRAKG